MKIILYLFLLQHSSFICTGAQKAVNEKALFTNKELPEVLKGTLKTAAAHVSKRETYATKVFVP